MTSPNRALIGVLRLGDSKEAAEEQKIEDQTSLCSHRKRLGMCTYFIDVKVTWNETLSWASCTKMGAVRETLWGVVGCKSTYFLVVSCRVPGYNLTGSSYGDSA